LLQLSTSCPIKAQNAGLFISRGKGTHPSRVINSHELIFVKRGVLEMWEEDRVFSLEEEQTLHLWPMRRHGGVSQMSPILEFYWIHFETVKEFKPKNPRETIIEIPQVKRVRQPEKLENLFRYFLDEQESGQLRQATADLLTMLMLIEVARPSDSKQENAGTVSIPAMRANTYIRLNFDRPITPGSVAQALGYNTDYLGRVYRKTFGYTLTGAINHRRIRAACRYLLNSDMIVEEVAKSCGFTDPNYFCRVFRRHMQCTPGAYRKLYARVHVNTQ